MENIIDKLQSLQVGGDDYVYLNYEESTSVWHISQVLARLLVTPGIRVFSRYEENILELMRDEGLLDGYEKDGTFEQYLVETIQKEAYEYDLLTISTERHDHKRGTCEIAANVKVFASELFKLGEGASSFVAGFDVVIQTKNGILTLA